jgi:hypothetical protein
MSWFYPAFMITPGAHYLVLAAIVGRPTVLAERRQMPQPA